MANKIKVAEYSEIPEDGMKAVAVGQKKILLYKIGGQIYATENECTHEQCYLDENGVIHFDVIECSCHGSQFDIKSGNVILPPATEGLQTYKAEVVGNDIIVDL